MKSTIYTYLQATALFTTCLLFAGCQTGSEKDSTAQTEEKPISEVQLEASLSERKLYVLRNNRDTLKIYDIAIGTPKYPTPTGSWEIKQIDWNPDWTPPESDWTEGESYTKPGAPDNPMGRVRIIYDSPYSLHGTEDINSLGNAESHGSTRMANNDVIELAKFLMEASGDKRPADWYEQVLANPSKMETVMLSVPVPLTNKE